MKTNQLKAMIVDDEPFAREDLKTLLAAHPEIQVVCEAGTIAGAEKLLQENALDVVFLDIQLRGGTGFDLVPSIDPSINIIFITAHDTFAIRAFEVNALDYLLKPVQAERLAAAIDRLRKAGKGGREAELISAKAFEPEDRILVKTDKGRLFVQVKKIGIITSMGGNYTVLREQSGEKLIIRRTMKTWQHMLPEPIFLRIHRSTIVNTSAVRQVLSHKTGSCSVCIGDSSQAYPVSRQVAPRLKRLLSGQSL